MKDGTFTLWLQAGTAMVLLTVTLTGVLHPLLGGLL